MRRLAVCLVLVSLIFVARAAPVLATADTRGAPQPVTYRAPVDAPIVDPFRPPPSEWAAGNRGVDYATAEGTAVSSAAPGEVVFAGNVGGSQHIVVLHLDGVRTSYSFLRAISVHRGDRVQAGQKIGIAGESVHFGARIGEAYVDPTLLFGDGPGEVYLVPNEDRRPKSEADERAGLFHLLERTISAALDAAAPSFDEVKGLVHWVTRDLPVTLTVRGAEALADWWDQRSHCTPGDEWPPSPPGAGHLLVLVAGLGSTSSSGAVFGLDAAYLGYDPGDVMRFSYRGGTTSDNPYDGADTTIDIRESARRLRDLLIDLENMHPGVPIDIVAHSQGGLVARSALTEEFDNLDPRLPKVATLVTLGTPHHGTDFATMSAMLGHSISGEAVQDLTAPLLGFDPGSTSVIQLSETSEFISRLNERLPPKGMNFTSIGARGDLVVPAGHTRLDGAANVVVSVPGGGRVLFKDHDNLPTSTEARREVALAMAGMEPTCQGFFDSMADTVVSEGISLFEDNVGAAAWLGANSVDIAASAVAP